LIYHVLTDVTEEFDHGWLVLKVSLANTSSIWGVRK